MTTPTIERLAEEAWADLRDATVPDGLTIEDLLPEIAGSVVTPVTSQLFAMVVEDNALAFLEFDGDAPTPFNALSYAIVEAIQRNLQARLDAEVAT